MISSKQIEYRRIAAIPRGVGVMCDFYAEKAENATITTIEGKQYIDFAGGIGVLNTGHLHPKVKAAVAAQLEKFSHTCYQCNGLISCNISKTCYSKQKGNDHEKTLYPRI